MRVSGYLGLDLGGTGAKASVFSESGEMLGFGRSACTPTTNIEGHVEVPIEAIHSAALEAVRNAVNESGAKIRAVAVSSQGQTFVSLDINDKPLHPAILWYDNRAVDQASYMKEAVSELNPDSSDLEISGLASAPKIMWLRERYPDAMANACRYLLLPDYISYKLTGQAVTDPNTAKSTGLCADDLSDYCSEALKVSGIEEAQLAKVAASGTPVARLLPDVAQEWCLDADTMFVVGTNDQYAGALGAGNCRPGIISETTGTCLALVTLTEKLQKPVPAGLFGGRFPIPKYEFALAYSKTAGVVIEWFNSKFCPGLNLKELGSMSELVPPGSNGITVIPHFDGMISPNPNPDTRGLIHGLTLNSGIAEIYRAILESIAYSLRENLELLKNYGFETDVIRSIGGGAKSDLWLQIKADVTGVPVERPKVSEAATLGAAMLAAVGVGDFTSIQESSQRLYHCDKIFNPDARQAALYERPYETYRRLCNTAF